LLQKKKKKKSFEKRWKNEIYHHHSHILAKFKVCMYICFGDDEGGRDEMCMKILCFAQVERQCRDVVT
jgi:hypothetical protein